MPALLIDLDNTLIDRAGAFSRWAKSFVTAHDGEPGDVAWLIGADNDGFQERSRLADLVKEHFGLRHAARHDVMEEIRLGLVENIRIDQAIPRALDEATAAGWKPVVVSNGTVRAQERKLRATGLDKHVAGWAISEAVGVRKPDPYIFTFAAQHVGLTLRGAWMVGDTPDADIAGANRSLIPSVWLRRGRVWQIEDFRPTLIADSCPEAIRMVLEA